MTKLLSAVSRSALTSVLMCGVMSAATIAGDLSKYRDFQLGTDLSTVARQAGADPSRAKVIHSRPALIQQLEWRPQPLGPALRTEPAKEVLFTFCDGRLFRIVIAYDRYETEGMTAADLVEAISASYGTASKPTSQATPPPGSFSDPEEVLAEWQDTQHSFELIRSPYGAGFKLVGVLKGLEATAQAAIAEAGRLDDKEAPQREAERMAKEDETARAKLEKARLVNKPKFRP